MEIKAVDSTNVKTMMFDKKTNMLYVIFQNKTLYKYKNVTEKEFLNLFKNKKNTVGELFYSNIREKKSYEIIY